MAMMLLTCKKNVRLAIYFVIIGLFVNARKHYVNIVKFKPVYTGLTYLKPVDYPVVTGFKLVVNITCPA